MTHRPLYHSTSPEARDSILFEGLHSRYSETASLVRENGDPDWESCGNVFLTSHPEDNSRIDVWEVDAEGLTLEPDDTAECPHEGETWWQVAGEGVPPYRLKLRYPASNPACSIR